MNNVVKLQAKATKQAKKRSKANRTMKRQGASAAAVGLVAGTLTALSLTHLAHGITIVTGAEQWESWAMAVGIDLGFVALEIAQLTASNDKVRKQIGKFCKPAIVGTLVGSAAMNAFAFAAQATGLMIGPAVMLGVAIPGLIYALTKVGAQLYIDCHSKG